ncbi:MAG: hypothetical protein HUJ68_06685 [Clostridia bacterium]|nr:hypothetical protein [Clostridia bacterium]
MHLREIIGNNSIENNQKDGTLRLDEKVISQEELNQKKQDKSIRIAEKEKDNYVTLSHLRG